MARERAAVRFIGSPPKKGKGGSGIAAGPALRRNVQERIGWLSYLAAALTVTFTWAFVQQHCSPPPPSPLWSLPWTRSTYSPGVSNLSLVSVLPAFAASTGGLAFANVTTPGPRY